jgi:hypothetical protein
MNSTAERYHLGIRCNPGRFTNSSRSADRDIPILQVDRNISRAKEIPGTFRSWESKHILRKYNSEVDDVAKLAIQIDPNSQSYYNLEACKKMDLRQPETAIP